MKRRINFVSNVIFIITMLLMAVACKKTNSSVKSKVSVIQTVTPTSITFNSAVSGGIITADEGIEVKARGVCWSTEPNPTISDSKTIDGSGVGSFISNITGLNSQTTYHVRAYFTSSSGTLYGSDVLFSTTAPLSPITEGFKVCGSKIFDPSGKEFIVKGVNVSGPGFPWPESTIEQFDNIVNKWKFNTIRLVTAGAPSLDSYTIFNCSSPNFPQYQYTTFGTVREIIKKYTEAKIVVIIDYHKVGGIFTDSELTCASSWWEMLANEYKNNPYLWFDMYNEPQVNSNDTWASSFQTVINRIRATGNSNIIVATGNWWGQDADDWNCENLSESKSAILSKTLNDPAGNLVYGLHVYDQWNQCQTKLDNFLDRAISKNKCVVVGEYGVYNNGDVSSAMRFALSSTQARKIGRIAWAWFGGDDNDLTTSGNGGGQNAVYDANGVPTNTSGFGNAVWADLHRTESLSTKKDCP